MPNRPPAPDDLPKYLREGIPKQSSEDLRAVQEWIDDLLKYRQNIDAEEISAGDDEKIEDIEESSEGTVVIKKQTCGKDNCKCQLGELHGPYKYIVRREGESLNWEYKGAVSQ